MYYEGMPLLTSGNLIQYNHYWHAKLWLTDYFTQGKHFLAQECLYLPDIQ